MPAALFILIFCQLLGESLRQVLHLPVPGPVIGLFMLAGALVWRNRNLVRAETTALDRMATGLLKYLGLLFVPAGVGVIAQLHLLQQQWLPIVAGLAGSTLLGLVVTGFVMHRLTRGQA